MSASRSKSCGKPAEGAADPTRYVLPCRHCGRDLRLSVVQKKPTGIILLVAHCNNVACWHWVSYLVDPERWPKRLLADEGAWNPTLTARARKRLRHRRPPRPR